MAWSCSSPSPRRRSRAGGRSRRGAHAAGEFLYAFDADARRIFGRCVAFDGRLAAVGAVEVSAATAAGLAAI
ncbi:MAG: hypothetical protein ACXVRV_15135 [Gaiellaceae bacterium]